MKLSVFLLLFIIVAHLYIFLEKCLFKCFACFENRSIAFFVIEFYFIFIYSAYISCQIYDLQVFFSFLWMSIHFLDDVQYKVLNFDVVLFSSIYLFFPLLLMLLASYLRNHCLTQGKKDSLLYFLLRVL